VEDPSPGQPKSPTLDRCLCCPPPPGPAGWGIVTGGVGALEGVLELQGAGEGHAVDHQPLGARAAAAAGAEGGMRRGGAGAGVPLVLTWGPRGGGAPRGKGGHDGL